MKVSKRGEPDKWAKVCTPIADYKGLAELMVRSGTVRHVEARVVYKGDKFTYRYGIDAMVEDISSHTAKERGEIVAAYVVLRLPFGQSSFEVMLIEDIEEIRAGSKQWSPDRVKKPASLVKTVVISRSSSRRIPGSPRRLVSLPTKKSRSLTQRHWRPARRCKRCRRDSRTKNCMTQFSSTRPRR